jgi:membrane-associated protein
MIHLLDFQWHDLINPEFYIQIGGLWLLLFIIFAETGLFAGFFLPGDSLLFLAGIFAQNMSNGEPGLAHSFLKLVGLGHVNNEWLDLFVLIILISAAGILGNMVGYWFGKKSGPFLYERKDTFFFKKKYLLKAHDFYNQYGGWAIVAARFVPIIRTFAPIVAGVVNMNRKKFIYFNIVGCISWVTAMLMAGHFLNKWIKSKFGYDLADHLEIIVIIIVIVSTAPIIYKFFFAKDKTNSENMPS